MAANLGYEHAIILEDDARLGYATIFPELLNLRKTYFDFCEFPSHNLQLHCTFGGEQRKDLTSHTTPYFSRSRKEK